MTDDAWRMVGGIHGDPSPMSDHLVPGSGILPGGVSFQPEYYERSVRVLRRVSPYFRKRLNGRENSGWIDAGISMSS